MPSLIRASRALRVVLRQRTDLDATEVLSASRKGSKSTMLAFVAPARDVEQSLVLSAGTAAHRHLPMVQARLRALKAPASRQYVRITRTAGGDWHFTVANLRVSHNDRLKPVGVAAVILRFTPTHEQLEMAVEVACRRAKLALAELDPTASESFLTDTLDELITAEAQLLKSQFQKR